MIIDTFIFFNELELLDIRLNILNDCVDRFVLVEATRTFQGKPKPLYFEENKSKFSKFKHKITHVIVDDLPVNVAPFDREYFQRDAILRGLSGCSAEDLIILSDLDEIPNPEVIPKYLEKGLIGLFIQNFFYYTLHSKCVELESLPCSLIVNFDEIGLPAVLRKRVVAYHSAILSKAEPDPHFKFKTIENGGWHFSYLGGPEAIRTKIEAYSHDELNIDEFKNIHNIQTAIADGRDIFGRKLSFADAAIEELPKFIVENFSAYKNKGLIDFSFDKNSYQKYLYRQRDAAIAERDAAIAERDAAIAECDATLAERDSYIGNLNLKAEEVSTWAHSLQHALTDKQAELSKISDWAYAMAQELNHLKAPIIVKAVNALSRIKSRIRARLARSYLGSIARYIRDTRRYFTNMVSLEVLRESLAHSNGRLIITFPIITWDFRWQRPQHIVTRLRDHGFAFLYVAMTIAPLARRFRGPKEAGAYLRFNNLAKNIDQVWLHSAKQLNIYTDPVEGDDLYNLTLSLESLIHELKPKSILYLLHFPGWWPIAKELRKRFGGKVIFDCMDDHGGFGTNAPPSLKTEHDLIAQADLVITSSAVLENKCRSTNPNTIQVKNGTEFEHFTNPVCNGQLDHLCDRPIIGYYGAISDWFDMGLVAHCASQRPEWNFVLIGATTGADLQPVEGLKNVHFLGEKPYKDLPGYLAYFDVSTIPFKITPLTMATNPVKFYEYLSAGKSVVSVDLPELHAYREDCYLAHNADEFLAQLKLAYNERDDEEKIGRRLKLASENSWRARVDSIIETEVFSKHLNI